MDSDQWLLADLIIEYFDNLNAAGEYNGKDPRLLTGEIDSEIFRSLAFKVKQQEEMRAWNL